MIEDGIKELEPFLDDPNHINGKAKLQGALNYGKSIIRKIKEMK